MSKYFKAIILVTLLMFLALPQVVSAGLVPCGRSCIEWGTDAYGRRVCVTPAEGVPIEEAQPCALCHGLIMIQRLLGGISLALFTWASIYILIGGFTIMTAAGIADKISQGKRMIGYAVIGLVIALGSWLIINTIMNALVRPQGMPWPWNKIECYAPPPGGPGGTAGEYCVCETPRYAYVPGTADIGTYPVIGTDVKVTKLASADVCKERCVQANFGQYCSHPIMALPASKYSLNCTLKIWAENIQTCWLSLSQEYSSTGTLGCRLGTECYDSADVCELAAKTTYRKQCFLDGKSLCDARQGGERLATFCPTGAQKNRCGNDPSKYVLYRWEKEEELQRFNAYQCSQRIYGREDPTDNYCRENCQYEKCQEERANVCNERKTFRCFPAGGIERWTCKEMVPWQANTACKELTRFLECIAGRIYEMDPTNKDKILVITSISDNSPLPASSGTNKGSCFDTDYWNSVGKCSGTTDSCTGSCCAHIKYSFHYGGAPGGEGGVAGCRECSWAVDLSSSALPYLNTVQNAVNECKKIDINPTVPGVKYGKVDVEPEGNHIHIELDYVGRNIYKCGSGE